MTKNSISNAMRQMIYRRDGWRCALCDCSRYLQIHHVTPRSRGGSDTEYNLITLCATCHACAHGLDMLGTGLSRTELAESMEIDCVEYLADHYAGQSMDEFNKYIKDSMTDHRYVNDRWGHSGD